MSWVVDIVAVLAITGGIVFVTMLLTVVFEDGRAAALDAVDGFFQALADWIRGR